MQYIFTHLNVANGFELLRALKPHYYVGDCNSWWWPSFLSVKIQNGIEINGALKHEPNLSLCFAAILGQNTKYQNAALALRNLYNFFYTKIIHTGDIASHLTTVESAFQHYTFPHLAYIAQSQYHNHILEILCNSSMQTIMPLIKNAGFYTQKSQRIITFAMNLLKDFKNFENFSTEVTKEWLLNQKGIGNETASSILNYALKREEIVVDAYTQRLLSYLGFEYEYYEDMQYFLTTNLEKAKQLYDFDISLAQIMARLHGKSVECGKTHRLKKSLTFYKNL